jgi:hypothetical protein
MNRGDQRSPLQRARFLADSREQEALLGDARLGPILQQTGRAGPGQRAREHYLAHAVRVDPQVLPALNRAFDEIRARSGVEAPMEAYVYAAFEMNAAVVQAADRLLVVLSSGAVERLTPTQLDFVIGHELGHACFGHLDMPVQLVLRQNKLQPREVMQLLAWQRQAEISADRVGLVCCGDMEAAATALFKTLSGLGGADLRIDARQFACQWDELAGEISRCAGDARWETTHPFPPLRMKALLHFWQSERAAELIPAAAGATPLAETEREIESLLAMMDPLARDRRDVADPMLRDFFLWGGLYIAAANDHLAAAELDHLRSLVGAEALDAAFQESHYSIGLLRERFLQAKAQRDRPLSGLEVHRIFSGLAAVAAADGDIDGEESGAIRELADAFNLNPQFVDTVLAQAA